MSLVTLFTKTSPTIGGIEFDAVLEDTFEASVDSTTYPIEAGANAVDHRVINPFEWSLIGVVSNNPIGPSPTDFLGGLTNFGGGGLAAGAAGLSAGYLSGSDETRSSAALSLLIELMVSAEPFDIDAGDIQLTNMQVVNILRVKDPQNEDALVFEAQLRELTELSVILTNQSPNQSQLQDGDPAKTQATESINKGEQGLQSASESDLSLAESVSS